MRWDEASQQYCSIARALGVLGDRWTLLIVREAFSGVRRFDDFRKHLGMARNVLADRLQRLLDAGVLELHPYQDSPPRSEYRLTDAGRELNGVLLAMMHWGDRFLDEQAGPPLTLEHVGCKRRSRPETTCSHCGEVLTARNTRLHTGPGMPQDVAEARKAEFERLRAQRS